MLAQTTATARQIAQANLNNVNVSDSSLIYPEDLFYIYVRSASIAPALPYVERMQGSASVFSSYIIGAANYTFVISNLNGKFGKRNDQFAKVYTDFFLCFINRIHSQQ